MRAASPISTVCPCDQRSVTTVSNAVQRESLPRSGRPSSVRWNHRAHRSADSASPHRSSPAARPDLLAHLDDDGGGVGGVRVGVQLHHAVRGLGDLEAEGGQGEVGGQPDVAAAVGGDARREHLRVGGPGGTAHPVGGDHQIVGGGQFVRGRRGLTEAQIDTECAAALVQHREQPTPFEGGEAVAAGGEGASAVQDLDVVPPHELGAQGGVHLRVGVLDPAQRLVGEDDAEAERLVRAPTFVEGDLAVRVQAFEQRRRVQPAGSAADHRDAHGASVPASGACASR